MSLPKIEGYGRYSSGNYGLNAIKTTVGPLEVWFSYRTPVAFRGPGTGLVVRQNDWGPTTGKHLNWIDGGDKKTRVDSTTFEEKYNAVMQELERSSVQLSRPLHESLISKEVH